MLGWEGGLLQAAVAVKLTVLSKHVEVWISLEERGTTGGFVEGRDFSGNNALLLRI